MITDAVADLSGYMLQPTNKSSHDYLSQPHLCLFTKVFMHINVALQKNEKHQEQHYVFYDTLECLHYVTTPESAEHLFRCTPETRLLNQPPLPTASLPRNVIQSVWDVHHERTCLLTHRILSSKSVVHLAVISCYFPSKHTHTHSLETSGYPRLSIFSQPLPHP